MPLPVRPALADDPTPSDRANAAPGGAVNSASRSAGPPGRVRATRKEEALWLLEKLAPGSAANNLSVAFQVSGRLQLWALRESLSTLLRRYQVLRTGYSATDTGLTRSIHDPDGCTAEIEQVMTCAGPVETDLTGFAARPFSLDGRLLLRAGLFRYDTADVFCLVVHHLIFDSLSSVPFLTEFRAVYESVVASREIPARLLEPIDALVEGEPTAQSLAFWHRELAGFDVTGLGLSCGSPDGADPSLVAGQLTRQLSGPARAAVRRLQKELRAPEAVVLLAAYYVLLDLHGAGPDLSVGSPVDVRPRGASAAIGYHVNVLPLRICLDGELSVRELVRRTRDVFFNALAHSDVPVDHLTAVLPRAGSSWREMLFRHLFNYVPSAGLPDFTIAGLPAQPVSVENGFSKFDLEFFIMSGSTETRIRAVYRTEVLGESDVDLLLQRYETLLLAFGADPDRPVGEVPAFSERDRAVVDAANATAAPEPAGSVLAAVAGWATASPAAIAVEDGTRTVSYQELWDTALAVRPLLAAAGVGVGDVVAVAATRGAALAASVLGVWLAGAAYLPIDPDHPAQRITYQLADSGAKVVISDGTVAAPAGGDLIMLSLPAVAAARQGDSVLAAPAAPDLTDVDGERCAYLIYTSGSTGNPKGTLVTHGGLANVVAHFVDELRATPSDAALWTTTFAFDISALELFVPLVAGGRVVAAPDAARVDGRLLRDLVERHRVGIVQATPTTWRVVLEHAAEALRGRRVLCGGESMPVTLARRLVATGCRLHHVYGPTETTIWSTSGPVPADPGARLDIGRPIRNTQVMVVDPAGRELPIGVRGELCIAGAGVALGYHRRPELTAEKFREHPRYGRYYQTGDVAQWRDDGTLELIGRGDRQVKLRGNRVELGEIEAVLLGHSEVKAVAVVLVGDASADAVLVAFVETAGGHEIVDALWEHARQALPRSLVPQEFIRVDALPANASQKVDYPALTRLAAQRQAGSGADRHAQRHRDEPGDELVQMLVALWQRLLERVDVDAGTNFFVSGGHSLLGALLLQQLEGVTGVRLRLAELFEEPTPARLAVRLRAAMDASATPASGVGGPAAGP